MEDEVDPEAADRGAVAPDAELRRQAEALSARLAAIVDSSDDAILTTTLDGTIATWNPGAERLYGYAATEVIGKDVSLLAPPASEDELAGLLDLVRRGEPVAHCETVRLRKDGTRLAISLSISPIKDAAERIVGASTIARDVSERKRAEQKIRRLDRLYVTLAAVNRGMVRALTRESLFAGICRVAVEEGGFRMAWVGLIDETDQLVWPVASAGHEDGYLSGLKVAYLDEELGRGPTGTAVREGRCVICQDIAGDPRMVPWRVSALERGYRSSACVPIRQGGAVIGALTVYAAEAEALDADDEGLLEEAGRDISFALDSLQASEAVRQSQAMRDSAEHAAHAGSFRWCLGAPGSAWSPEVRELFDVTPGEFDDDIVRAIGARVHSDDLEALGRRVADVVANGALSTVEFRVVHRDGAERVIMAGGTGERDAEGKVVALVGYVRDVTDQRRAEAAMRESAERHNAILQTTMDGFVIVDTRGRLLEVNEAYCRMSGYGSAELLSMSLGELEYAEAEDDTRAHIEKIIAQGEDRFETRHRRKDGSVYDIEASVQYHPSEGGQFVAFLRDITERRRAERLMSLPSEILAIMARSRPVVETAQEIVAALQLATGFDAVGLRLRQGDDYPFIGSLGYSGEFLRAENDLAERDPGGGLCRNADGSISLECTCGLVIGGATDPADPLFTPGGSVWTNDSLPFLEVPPEDDPRLHPRNRCIHVGFRSLALVPLRAGDEILGLLHLADCGTDRFTPESVDFFEGLGASIGLALQAKRAQEEILRLNTELEQRVAVRTAQLEATNKELEAFSYSVSHDLRAPLRAIDGFSHIIVEDESEALSEAGRENLARVRIAAQRMGQLIDALLALSRASRKELNIGRVDVSGLASGILAGLREQDPARHVRAQIAEGCTAVSDVDLVDVVLTNLLGNAWKFTGGREEAHIEFGETSLDGERVFYVRDDGAGFEAAYADKLFQPFQRLHPAEDFPGTGIGLATVRRIVARLGGRCWAEAELEKGATFYFTLPEPSASV